MGLNGGEPWPALVLPGFKNVWDDGNTISMPVADFRIYFGDGTHDVADPRIVLSSIPASHHLAIMRRQFCPASISGSTGTERGRLPETRQWLATRIADLYPGKKPVRVHVEWRRLELSQGDNFPGSVPLDTLKIELR